MSLGLTLFSGTKLKHGSGPDRRLSDQERRQTPLPWSRALRVSLARPLKFKRAVTWRLCARGDIPRRHYTTRALNVVLAQPGAVQVDRRAPRAPPDAPGRRRAPAVASRRRAASCRARGRARTSESRSGSSRGRSAWPAPASTAPRRGARRAGRVAPRHRMRTTPLRACRGAGPRVRAPRVGFTAGRAGRQAALWAAPSLSSLSERRRAIGGSIPVAKK